MEDITGLGKIVDSEVVKRAYDDVAHGALKQVGEAATDLAKALRLFTYPIQLAANFQERLRKKLDEVRESVPSERQQEAAPEIAGPVIRALVFVPDDSYLMDMYLNLLKRAIDKERASEAHPAFPRIIEQLSPDEALILFLAHQDKHRLKMDITYPDGPDPLITLRPAELALLTSPHNAMTYLRHLESLGLGHFDVWQGPGEYFEYFYPTAFGTLFAKACIPSGDIPANWTNSAK